MSRYFVIFFMFVGAGDFLYGIFFKDRISVLVGAIILILAIYVARKQRKETKDETAP
jgi:positive regulator of sigma E activity